MTEFPIPLGFFLMSKYEADNRWKKKNTFLFLITLRELLLLTTFRNNREMSSGVGNQIRPQEFIALSVITGKMCLAIGKVESNVDSRFFP